MTKLGNFDFREFEKYRDNLKAMEKAVPGFLEECVQELAKRLLDKSIGRTPTDQEDVRRGWTIGNVIFTSNGAAIQVFNVNESSSFVEYGQRLANGRGWKEGKFMMTISLKELEQQIPTILEKKMKRCVKGFLG
ncbi:MAG: HK97 gp10 family phage protein [Candidatus Pristimantibacillus lignocellulolyticus]|uniref:HK97 gp10 family phage protein n=1 Tax=Candidatus Pristimantibacillus lignocellulolyticus TaxID=2994561 RepID=A0A9J6ZEX9_9BACL|nr:MAG: HK97 gp10 family phage protein [Candidatus Pristimantibacillus lignocellulolyticus]